MCNQKLLISAVSLIFLLPIPNRSVAQTLSVWQTNPSTSQRLERVEETGLSKADAARAMIKIDASKKLQSVEGFGFTLTQGSAVAIMQLEESQRQRLLEELFGDSGLNISMLRIGVGATDLSTNVYSYDEHDGDVAMKRFSLDGPDRQTLLPLMKQIQTIQPDIKWMASPWTAPTWMKSNDGWIGGKLKPEFYPAYARYLVKYLQSMKAEGLEIWAMTPQNEPENPHNEPSLVMDADEQLRFIDKYLGPAIRKAKLDTKIIAYDHNCDHPEYPIAVLKGSKFAAGAAFHLYSGDISAMTTVHEATGKDVYFTEQWVSSDGGFAGDLRWHLKNVVIGSLQNYSRSVLEWNLANLADFTPHTPGGCSKCKGAITIVDASNFERNVAYYVIGHISKFVRPGAVRIASTASGMQVQQVVLQNTDGTIVLITLNESKNDTDFTIKFDNQAFETSIAGGSVATFIISKPK